MDPIGSFSGLASGFQWRDMVDQMMQLEIKRRFTPVQNQVDAATKRREAWTSFNGLLSKFSASAQALRDGGAFGALQTSLKNGPAGKTLFSATASSTATAGSYQVTVVDLARADKLSGGPVASTSEALGITGDFYVNGKRIEVAATDTLSSVRNAINAANTGGSASGVSATILSTSSTEHRLVLTSEQTGYRGLELADGEGGVLQQLGITTGALEQNTKVADPTSTQSKRMTSSSSPLAEMLGVTAPPATTTIKVGDATITVDLVNDTLLTLQNRIAAAEIAATTETEKHGSTEMVRLTVGATVTADDSLADPADSQRVVELLGFQKGVLASSITAGQDSLVQIDGFDISRRSNVISDAITGVTLNLQAEDEGATTDLVITRDTGAVVKAAEGMVEAYNALVDFVSKEGAAGGALASNSSLRTTMNSITRTLLEGVDGLPEDHPYTHASFTGIELTKEGKLKVDSAKLKSVLETNFADVQALLTTSGSSTDAEIEYVLAGKTTAAGAYAVDITQAATQATNLGAVWGDPAAYAASDGVSDTLSLTLGAKSVEVTIEQGTSLAALVAALNSKFADEAVRLTASNDGGALRITAQDYGSSTTFSAGGTAAAGLGLDAGFVAGLDVAGTIGGLAATGKGRSLTGADGGDTAGLVVRYTGTTARAAGELRFTLGVGGLLDRVVQPAIRANDGTIASQLSSIDRSIESMNKRLDDIESRLEVRRQSLISQFSRMEGAMSLLQSQSSWLGSQIQSMNGSKQG